MPDQKFSRRPSDADKDIDGDGVGDFGPRRRESSNVVTD